MKATFFINIIMPNGTPIDEVTVVVDYDAIYEPARLSARWEDSSPMYTSMMLNSVEVKDEYFDNDDQPINNLDVHIQVLAKYQDRLEDKCWDHFHERRADIEYDRARCAQEEF